MTQEKETFLARWSRVKRESDLPEKQDPEQSPAPALPPVDELKPDSDFSAFMHPKVEDALRRVALKKLFSDPHFNVPDPYEAYSGDWTGGEPIGEELLAQLKQTRTLLSKEGQQEQPQQKLQPQQEPQPQEAAAGKPKEDEPGRQDT